MRIKQNAKISTREARRRLITSPEPYWHTLEKGLALGYRKSGTGGTWIVRRYDPVRRRYIEARIGMADDYRHADGHEVLDFGQAQRQLLAEAHQGAMKASGQLVTVSDAVEAYVDYLRAHGKSAADAQSKLATYVLPRLGTTRVAALTEADIDGWVTWALKRKRRKRGAPAQDLAEGSAPTDPAPAQGEQETDAKERVRRRKVTINRVINAFKAALKRAGAADKVLKRLKKFRAVDSARTRWLTLDEAQRLQNACREDFRPLVRAALLTGCRAGEVMALQGGDFDPYSNTLLIADSKSGKPRRVPLTPDGAELFEQLSAGKAGARLLSRANGSRWYRVAIARAMGKACAAAGVTPPATFHILRPDPVVLYNTHNVNHNQFYSLIAPAQYITPPTAKTLGSGACTPKKPYFLVPANILQPAASARSQVQTPLARWRTVLADSCIPHKTAN